MTNNPFEDLHQRLSEIELLINTYLTQIVPANNSDSIGGIELAEAITKLKKSTIYSHVHNKKIPFHKKLGKLYFSKNELERWIVDKPTESVLSIHKEPLFPYFKKTKIKYA